MREIKFRGYNGLEWLYTEMIRYVSEDDFWQMMNHETDEWDCVSFIGQYTGLKDKNGKEIYEGDIVNWNSKIGYIGFLKQEMGYCIIFKNTDSRLGHRNIGSGYDFNVDIEIIGNIYEHSELLEVKQ